MKKNILIIIPTLSGGGAEKVAANLSKVLSKKYNLYLIIFQNEITYDYSGKIINLGLMGKNNFFSKLSVFLKRIIKLKKIKKKYNIDLSISFLDSGNIVNIISKYKDKTILSIRNFKSKENNGVYSKIYAFMIKKLFNKANKIVSISDLAKEDLINNFNIKRDKIITIYNPYDLDDIDNKQKEKIENEYKKIFEKPTIITAGRLHYQKAHWSLIKSFYIAKKDIKNLQLVILGKGDLEKDLKKLCKDLNLENSVHFLGYQINPYKYIKNADIFVLSSLYEGFPNALVEAMSCGKPVISTDCPSGPREILAPDTDIFKKSKNIEYAKYGILIPELINKMSFDPDDINEKEIIMANAIKKLITDKSLSEKYSKLGKERVKDFEIFKISQKWIDLIDKELTDYSNFVPNHI